jgi:L-ascorbate metabolism protein UlaG (beta-lactamase superfamily)
MKPILLISIITGLATMLFFKSIAPAVCTSDIAPSSKTAYSIRYSDGTFNSNVKPMDSSFGDFVATTWDFLFSGKNRTPYSKLPHNPVNLSPFNDSADNQLNVTWLGHSSLMINVDGYKILTDPVFEKRVSILGPTRFNGDMPLDISTIPSIDVVIISHDHYDHLNKFSIRHLNQKTEKFIVPLAVGARMAKWGVPESKIVELNWWEAYRFHEHLTVIATPAQHFSGRGLTDRNKTLWASWVIKTPSHSLFFSGDSGYFDGFKQIGNKYGPFDMTFIECGAYNKSWSDVHMFPEQTLQAHLDLKGNVLHPIHWGTFNLALHPWYEPMERITTAAQENHIALATPVVGGTTIYNTSIPVARWWRQAMAQTEKLKTITKE